MSARATLAERLEPSLVGWQAHARPFAFEPEIRFAAGAARFLTGTPNVPALYAATAGYDIVEEIHIAAGNHDPLLRPYIGEVVTIHKPTGFRLGDTGFVHGHAWPSEEVMAAKVLLMGHNHPAVVFVDAFGARHVQPCWVRVPFRKKHPRYGSLPREAVVVPAFNELCGGVPVNDVPTGRYSTSSFHCWPTCGSLVLALKTMRACIVGCPVGIAVKPSSLYWPTSAAAGCSGNTAPTVPLSNSVRAMAAPRLTVLMRHLPGTRSPVPSRSRRAHQLNGHAPAS